MGPLWCNLHPWCDSKSSRTLLRINFHHRQALFQLQQGVDHVFVDQYHILKYCPCDKELRLDQGSATSDSRSRMRFFWSCKCYPCCTVTLWFHETWNLDLHLVIIIISLITIEPTPIVIVDDMKIVLFKFKWNSWHCHIKKS